jgi:hypothetical protein
MKMGFSRAFFELAKIADSALIAPMEALIDVRRLVRILTVSGVLSLGLVLDGCKKPVASEETPEETAPSAAAPSATPPPASQPVAVVTPAPATPAPELAPPGVFYLLAAARVETTDGIMGLPPGTGVKLVRPGVYLTPAGEAPLDASKLTNDMGVARRARDRDRLTQTALQKQIATQAAAESAAQAALANGSKPGGNSSSPGAAQQDEKMAARQAISRQLEADQRQMNDLSASLNQFVPKFGSWDTAAKKSPQAYQLLQQLRSLESERDALTAKMSEIR